MSTKRIIGRENEVDSNEKKLTYDLTYKDVVDILEIIDHSVCRELSVELGDLKLTVVKRGSSEPAVSAGEE